jgi:membrane-associated phospholipid phosphatase
VYPILYDSFPRTMRPHRFKRNLIALTLSLLVAFPVAAQQPDPQDHAPAQAADPNRTTSNPPQSSAQDNLSFRRFLNDEYRLWTSPFRPGNYDSHTMKKYGLPFLLISGALIATDHKTADLLSNTETQTTWSGRVSQLGASYTLAGFSGATYLIGKAKGDDHAKETGILSLEALGHAQLLALGIKAITQRERPLGENPSGTGFWKGGDSFPSGHATSSFAVATVFAYEYRDHIAVPITAYSLASLISLSRLSARRHWASDIFVGGSLGFLIGRYVYKHHHNPNLPGSPGYRISRLIPNDFTFADARVGLYWVF